MDDQAVTCFWDNYIEQLKAYGIKPKLLRWHVSHAEECIKAHAGRRLAAHSAADVERYLNEKGRNVQLKDWQFRQIVKSLQVLFC